jgi:transcriptional regulator with XRE-family HTH domain
MTLLELGETIRRLRKEKGLTQAETAHKAGSAARPRVGWSKAASPMPQYERCS